MRDVMAEIWDADLPMELCADAQELHDVGLTFSVADDLDVYEAARELIVSVPEDAGLLDFLPDGDADDKGLADEMTEEESGEMYESLLCSCAAVLCGEGKEG